MTPFKINHIYEEESKGDGELMGFCMGGDRNKRILVNDKHQSKLARIFQDSESEEEEEKKGSKTEELMMKLDQFES